MDSYHEYNEEGLSYLFNNEAYVFNISRERFDTHTVIQNRIRDEEFGESIEQVDLFAIKGNSFSDIFSVLDKEKYLIKQTDSGSGYFDMGEVLLAYDKHNNSYEGVMVISNITSNYLPDKKTGTINCEYFHFIDNELDKFFHQYSSVHGFFAKKRIRVSNINNLVVLVEDLHNEGEMSDYQYSLYNDYIRKFDEGSK